MRQSSFIDLDESSVRYFSEISKALLAEHYVEIENPNVFRDRSKPLIDIVDKYGTDTVLSHIRSLGINPSNCKFDFNKASHVEVFLELAGCKFLGIHSVSHVIGGSVLEYEDEGLLKYVPMSVVDKLGFACVGDIGLHRSLVIELQFTIGPTKYDIFKCYEVRPPDMPVVLFQSHLYETDYIEYAKYWRLKEDWNGN